jgi:hypothetical protein
MNVLVLFLLKTRKTENAKKTSVARKTAASYLELGGAQRHYSIAIIAL